MATVTAQLDIPGRAALVFSGLPRRKPCGRRTRVGHSSRLRLADLVGGERPPGAHLLGEYPPRHLQGRFHDHDLPQAVRLVTFRFHLLFHHDLFSCFVVSRSAASLNALSASSQNPSSQLRSASIPRTSVAYSLRVPSARATTSRACLSTARC